MGKGESGRDNGGGRHGHGSGFQNGIFRLVSRKSVKSVERLRSVYGSIYLQQQSEYRVNMTWVVTVVVVVVVVMMLIPTGPSVSLSEVEEKRTRRDQQGRGLWATQTILYVHTYCNSHYHSMGFERESRLENVQGPSSINLCTE